MKVIPWVVLLGACAGMQTPPNLEAADRIVWDQAYGMDISPPRVDWISDLNCADDLGFIDPWGRCVAGLFYDEAWLVEVAVPRGKTLHELALAHEYLHAALYKTTGDPEPNHDGAQWAPGGLLDQALQRLIEGGQ